MKELNYKIINNFDVALYRGKVKGIDNFKICLSIMCLNQMKNSPLPKLAMEETSGMIG